MDVSIEEEEASVTQVIEPSPTRSESPIVEATKRKKGHARKSTATSIGDRSEMGRDVESRLSLARSKSRDAPLDSDPIDEGDTMGAGPSFSYDAESADIGNDQMFDDDVGGDTRADFDDGASEEDFGDTGDTGAPYDDQDQVMEPEGDISLEAAAVRDAERGGGSTESEEEEREDRVPLKPKKVRQPTVPREREPSTAKSNTRKRTERSGSEKARAAEKKKIRVSRIGVPDDEDETQYRGDFTTRSGRKHFKPLDWWRGEKFNYGRGPGLPVIKEVVHLEDDDKRPLGARKRGNTRNGRSVSTAPVAEPDEGDGWDEATEPIGLVKEFSTDRDIQRREWITFGIWQHELMIRCCFPPRSTWSGPRRRRWIQIPKSFRRRSVYRIWGGVHPCRREQTTQAVQG